MKTIDNLEELNNDEQFNTDMQYGETNYTGDYEGDFTFSLKNTENGMR
jgi:hypothetical protein